MSEQLIPLRIADQAVAACNAEIVKLQEDNARLKRQVEELKQQPDPLTAYLYAAELSKDNVRRLKAFAERLIKAGDAMASDLLSEFGHKEMLKYQPYQKWIAAKEGKTDEA
jgi:N-acetylglucosamine kinase-like BadF-type ATPase